MIRRICAAGAALALAGCGIALSGCGSSSSSSSSAAGSAASASHTTTLPSGQTLVEAADRAQRASGYRIAATIDVDVGSTPLSMQMQGVVQRHGPAAALTSTETVAGHALRIQVRLMRQTLYMSGIPGLAKAAHGKHWLSFNLARAEQAEGLGGLQGSVSSNPAQFLDYLRTVGSHVTRVGTATIDGDPTTEYRGMIDLDRYTKLLPPARRATARASIARLEADLGARTLPVTVWVDRHDEARRMHLALTECIAGHHVSVSMTMNLSDYGHVPPVAIPSASDTDDITGKLTSALPSQSAQTGGCSATST